MRLTEQFNLASHPKVINNQIEQRIWVLIQHISRLRAQITRLQQGYDL